LRPDLVHLGSRELAGARPPARRPGPQPPRTMTWMARLSARAVRLAALAVGGVDAAGPGVPGRGQPRVQLRPLLLQLGQGWLGHGLLLSGSLDTSRLGPQPAPSQEPYIRVAHPLARGSRRQTTALSRLAERAGLLE